VEAAAFASDLEELILRHRPVLWVHGHIHHATDYLIGATTVVCNPRGYQAESWSERSGWNEELVVEV
jgi:Icc-related predicted phosphoesterase